MQRHLIIALTLLLTFKKDLEVKRKITADAAETTDKSI